MWRVGYSFIENSTLMKTILTIAFIAFLTITTSAVATNVHPSYTHGTTSSCFSYFRVHRQMNGAGLMWGVNQQGISKFIVELSYDGEYYDKVEEVPAHGSSQYRFTHRDAFPGLLHYRLTAVMADGSTSEAPVQTVRIIARK